MRLRCAAAAARVRQRGPRARATAAAATWPGGRRWHSSMVSSRVGCDAIRPGTKQPAAAANGAKAARPLGFVRYREQMARMGAALSFRVPHADCDTASTKVSVRKGCIGDAVQSGRFAAGGIVTPSNPLMCGNQSDWWGFKNSGGIDLRNVDGLLRELAPGLATECSELKPIGPSEQRLLPGMARATGAGELRTACVIHALGPPTHHGPASEMQLREASP